MADQDDPKTGSWEECDNFAKPLSCRTLLVTEKYWCERCLEIGGP